MIFVPKYCIINNNVFFFEKRVAWSAMCKGADGMAEKNKVEVRIAGKDYTLVGCESEEYIQKVALYIDKKMTEIMRMNNKLSTSMASVLTAVNVADEYFKAQEEIASLSRELKSAKEEIERLKEETGGSPMKMP